MDEVTSLWFLVGLFALVRFLNNLLKAGYFNLGQITRISLAERSKEHMVAFWSFIQDPQRLSISAQLVDKLALVALLCLYYIVRQPVTPWDALILFAYIVFLDMFVTNALGALYPEQLVLKLFPYLHPLYIGVGPVAMIMVKLAFDKRERDDERSEEEEDVPEDITAFLRAGTEEGIIEEKEKVLFRNLLVFSDTVVREVMTPRTDMVCVDHSRSPEEILELFKTTKYSRIPVYKENIDQIEGVLRFKDLVEMMDKHTDITDYLKETFFVPENKNISDLLQEMLKRRIQMVIVIDEFGGTEGLITLEDLIEEIIGEIHDEHETPESDEIIPLENGDFLIDGKFSIADFCEMFDTDTNNMDVDTIGGYIFNKEGQIPKEGDHSDICGIPVEIIRADTRRIFQVRVMAPEAPVEELSE